MYTLQRLAQPSNAPADPVSGEHLVGRFLGVLGENNTGEPISSERLKQAFIEMYTIPPLTLNFYFVLELDPLFPLQ